MPGYLSMFWTSWLMARESFSRRGILESWANSSVMVPAMERIWDSRERLWLTIMMAPIVEVVTKRIRESITANLIFMPILSHTCRDIITYRGGRYKKIFSHLCGSSTTAVAFGRVTFL